MDNCIFCKIVKGDIPSYKTYEDEKYLAFLDISHFTDGHTLVIPKKHHQFVWDVNDSGYFEVCNKIANHYKNLGFKYVDSMVFGRMIAHAHIHLVPHNDDGSDYSNALNEIGILQTDVNRRLKKEDALKMVEKFKLL
jgi:histidine triad (HIT) family protein